jgi:hypothetical protein
MPLDQKRRPGTVGRSNPSSVPSTFITRSTETEEPDWEALSQELHHRFPEDAAQQALIEVWLRSQREPTPEPMPMLMWRAKRRMLDERRRQRRFEPLDPEIEAASGPLGVACARFVDEEEWLARWVRHPCPLTGAGRVALLSGMSARKFSETQGICRQVATRLLTWAEIDFKFALGWNPRRRAWQPRKKTKT